MGAKFFAKSPQPSAPNSSMEGRAMGAASYAAPKFGGSASKDLGAALGANSAGMSKPVTKSAATDAPGPKRI